VPVKQRTAKSRRPQFSAEVVALFAELEGIRQGSKAFEDGSHELARRLNLVGEWWRGSHVLDRSPGPCHPPDCVAYEDWFHVRRVRKALLAAVAEQEKAPAAGEGEKISDSRAHRTLNGGPRHAAKSGIH
jgi:hypothetical protein